MVICVVAMLDGTSMSSLRLCPSSPGVFVWFIHCIVDAALLTTQLCADMLMCDA